MNKNPDFFDYNGVYVYEKVWFKIVVNYCLFRG